MNDRSAPRLLVQVNGVGVLEGVGGQGGIFAEENAAVIGLFRAVSLNIYPMVLPRAYVPR